MGQGIVLTAVGDVLLGDSAICVGFGLRSRYPGKKLEQVVHDIKPLLANADIVFGNLETVLSHSSFDSTSWASSQMRGDPEYAAVLREAGFTVMNVANNHAVQHGEAAFEDSLNQLRKAGIAICGERGVDGWCSKPLTITVRDQQIGFLGYCLRPRQYSRATPPYAEGTLAEIEKDVQRLRPDVTQVIVSLHWGEEFVHHVSADEAELARAVIGAGAALVVGHHPHVTRPIERYGNGVIVYSMGNFVADMIWQDDLRSGLVISCTFDSNDAPELKTVTTRVGRDFRVQPMPHPATMPGTIGVPGGAYKDYVRQGLRSQRKAAYLYALRNLPRYPGRILFQFARQTLLNKLTRGRR